MRWRFWIDEPTWILWLLPMIFVAFGFVIMNSTFAKIIILSIGLGTAIYGIMEMWIEYDRRMKFQEKMAKLYGE